MRLIDEKQNMVSVSVGYLNLKFWVFVAHFILFKIFFLSTIIGFIRIGRNCV